MYTRIEYDRVCKGKKHVKMLRAQIIQHKFRDENPKQAKDEMKGSFYVRGCGLVRIIEGEEKIKGNREKMSS